MEQGTIVYARACGRVSGCVALRYLRVLSERHPVRPRCLTWSTVSSPATTMRSTRTLWSRVCILFNFHTGIGSDLVTERCRDNSSTCKEQRHCRQLQRCGKSINSTLSYLPWLTRTCKRARTETQNFVLSQSLGISVKSPISIHTQWTRDLNQNHFGGCWKNTGMPTLSPDGRHMFLGWRGLKSAKTW